MKSIYNKAIILLLLISAIACKKDAAIDFEQKIRENLASKWVVSNVFYDGDGLPNPINDFLGFSIQFDANHQYQTQNSANYGPFSTLQSGNWSFVGELTDSNYQIKREEDGLIIDVRISENDLILTFNFIDSDKDGHHDSRLESVDGQWTFEFKR